MWKEKNDCNEKDVLVSIVLEKVKVFASIILMVSMKPFKVAEKVRKLYM